MPDVDEFDKSRFLTAGVGGVAYDLWDHAFGQEPERCERRFVREAGQACRSEMREFLASRRARITPEQAGLRTYGNGPRRVPALRCEEVALLAGVSIAYDTKLVRGDTSGL